MTSRFLPALAAVLTLTAPAALAQDLTFQLVNQSSDSVVGFYVSDSDTVSWEENLLEGAFLPSGNEIDVLIADGLETCTYDIKTVFSNGYEFEEYDINLCELGTYTMVDR